MCFIFNNISVKDSYILFDEMPNESMSMLINTLQIQFLVLWDNVSDVRAVMNLITNITLKGNIIKNTMKGY